VTHRTLESAPELVLVRYGELGLKGKNRGDFEATLVRNIRAAVEPISDVAVERERGRVRVTPRQRLTSVARRLQQVFGIVSVSPAWGVEPTPEAIARAAGPIYERARAGLPADPPVTFRVRGSRADKDFPLTSSELERFVADRVLPDDGSVVVDLEHPRLELGIDVRAERAYLFAERLPGPGGLPVGTLGRVLCLISGGIDSPVAAWMAMKRGAEVALVTFHSAPYLGEPSKRKVLELARVLARWQPRTRLYVAPFGPVQEAIRDGAPESYRTVLYRRMMQRIASRLAAGEGALALVTGESLGQVASQTLENLTCIEDAAELPVLRPLVAFDKQETIALAREIGTFELSCLPEPDCCTVFLPRRAVIRGKKRVCAEIEAGLDVRGLVEASVAGVEVHDLA
jgi:thiamine biosynthesis protein ThiI